jgi:NAD(P)-dependent dehydrogenase (short-subunit alcohol dehydrogenase family)
LTATADSLDLHGQVILITGGCGDLGLPIVSAFLAHGASVIVNDILSPEDAASRLPDDPALAYVPGAVTDVSLAASLVQSATEQFGATPTTVCCHAGLVGAHPIDAFPLDEFDSIIATNLRGSFLLAQAAASRWKSEGTPGHIVFTSSWVANTPWPGIAPYSASKAALNSLTRSFARELAPAGIRANALAPGIVDAGMARHQWDTDPDYRQRAERAIPLGYLQDTSSVANAMLFLVSPLAAYMTGAVLTVDGGSSLYPMDPE